MPLFKKKEKPAKPARPPEVVRLEKIRKEAAATAVKYLEETFLAEERYSKEKKIGSYVRRFLRDLIDDAICDAVGVTRSFDRHEVKYGSPLHKAIKEVATQQAYAMVDKHLAGEVKVLPKLLPANIRDAVNKKFEEEYEDALLERAVEIAKDKAAKDAEAVIQKALGVQS